MTTSLTTIPAGLRQRLGSLLFSEAILPRVCRAIGPSLAGRLCGRLARPPARRGSGPAYLFIVRDVAYKDLEQLREHSRGTWIALSQSLLYQAQRAWLPANFFRQLEFQRRMKIDSSLKQREALRFATALLADVRRRHGIEAVVASNVDFAHDEFLRLACQAAGVPFVALLKEHVNTDYGGRAWSAEYFRTGFRYEGDAVAVFGPRTRDIMIAHQVCDPDLIHVTGPPRFDAWASVVSPPAPDTAVLCGFSHPGQEGAAAFPEVLRAFVALVDSRPDLSFVVKCRDHFESARVTAMLGGGMPGVTITHEMPMSELLSRAAVVAGFGSLALVEALYSPAEVVSIRFAGCLDEEDVQFEEGDRQVAELVRFAHSAEELAELVRAAPRTARHPQQEARTELLHRFFCAPRPTHSAALDAVLDEAIHGARRPAADAVLA